VRALKRNALLLALALGGSPEPSIVAHAGDIFEDAADAGPYCDIGALLRIAEEYLPTEPEQPCLGGCFGTMPGPFEPAEPCGYAPEGSTCLEQRAKAAREAEIKRADQRRIVETCRAVLTAREKK
jgi:hypothetical protein